MRSLVGKRKTATPPPFNPGGNLRGVVTTDPAGRQTVAPFTGDNDDVLRGDGTFGSLPPVSASAPYYMEPLVTGPDPATSEFVFAPNGDVVSVPIYF